MQLISKVWWPMSGKVSSFKLFPVFSVLFILCREDDEHFVGHARYADTVRNASQKWLRDHTRYKNWHGGEVAAEEDVAIPVDDPEVAELLAMTARTAADEGGAMSD